MEAKKIIIPVAVVGGGFLAYNYFSTDWRQKLLNLPEFDKNYYIKLQNDASPVMKKKYAQYSYDAYKVNEIPLVTGLLKDATQAEVKKMASTSSIFNSILDMFLSKKYNDGQYTLAGLKEAKTKYQLSILLARIFNKGNTDIKKKVIDEYSTKACREIYQFVTKLPIIVTK